MITDEQLTEIAGWLNTNGYGEECLSPLRQQYPGVHFTWCLDDDVVCNSVAREETGYNIYLVDGNDHCLAFTANAEAATGVVIAEVVED